MLIFNKNKDLINKLKKKNNKIVFISLQNRFLKSDVCNSGSTFYITLQNTLSKTNYV